MAKLQIFESVYSSEGQEVSQNIQHADSSFEEDQGSFVRLEDKYLLSAEQISRLTPLVNLNMKNAAPNPKTDYTLIRSVYFDDKNLACLRSYLSSESKRFKLRTRQYAPNGLWSDNTYLEYKAKIEGVCKKSRIEIDSDSLANLVTGQEIIASEKLININELLKERTILKRLKRINDAVKNMKLEPLIQVQYSRLAYQDDSIRLTIDKDITTTPIQAMSMVAKLNITRNPDWSQALKSTQRLASTYPHVLEVKHAGEIPPWLTLFLAEENIMPVKFSKYCLATSFPLLDSVHEGQRGQSI